MQLAGLHTGQPTNCLDWTAIIILAYSLKITIGQKHSKVTILIVESTLGAKKNGFLKSIDAAPLYKRLINIIPSEPPSLIHGDLWGFMEW